MLLLTVLTINYFLSGQNEIGVCGIIEAERRYCTFQEVICKLEQELRNQLIKSLLCTKTEKIRMEPFQLQLKVLRGIDDHHGVVKMPRAVPACLSRSTKWTGCSCNSLIRGHRDGWRFYTKSIERPITWYYTDRWMDRLKKREEKGELFLPPPPLFFRVCGCSTGRSLSASVSLFFPPVVFLFKCIRWMTTNEQQDSLAK